MRTIMILEPCNTAPYNSLLVDVTNEETWRTSLDAIEQELDAQFVNNNNKLEGVKLEVTFKQVTDEWLAERTED